MRKPDPSEKALLSPMEVVQYYHLQQAKLYALLKEKHDFVVCYRSRRFVIKSELEKFFREHPDVKEKLNGYKT